MFRFLDDGTIKYYQSQESGEIFGIQGDSIVAYLKKWNGTPFNEAITIQALSHSTPYIYQCTDHQKMYEWHISNCYAGFLIEDTGKGMNDKAPLNAEIYVIKKSINKFFR